jgi:hypothetical protein
MDCLLGDGLKFFLESIRNFLNLKIIALNQIFSVERVIKISR